MGRKGLGEWIPRATGGLEPPWPGRESHGGRARRLAPHQTPKLLIQQLKSAAGTVRHAQLIGERASEPGQPELVALVPSGLAAGGTAPAQPAFLLGRDGNSAALAALCERNKEQEPVARFAVQKRALGSSQPGKCRSAEWHGKAEPDGASPGMLPVPCPGRQRAAPAHTASCEHRDGGDPAVTVDGFAATPVSPHCDASLHPGGQSGMPGSKTPGTRQGKTVGAVLG